MMEKFTQTWDLRLLQRDLIARVCNHAGRFLKHCLGMWTMCTMWIFTHCCHLRTTKKGEDVHLCAGDWCIFALLHHHLVLWKRFVAQDWTCINLSALPRRYFTILILNTIPWHMHHSYILPVWPHSDICMCAIIPWFNFLLSVVELCKGIVSVDWIWMVCTCSVDSLVAAACYKVQLFVLEQSCCPPHPPTELAKHHSRGFGPHL